MIEFLFSTNISFESEEKKEGHVVIRLNTKGQVVRALHGVV